MATTTLICRLCKTKAIPTQFSSLFSNSAVAQSLAGRITKLLDVSIDRDDGLPAHICRKCKRRFDGLEKAATDLEDFRITARESKKSLLSEISLKRRKESSGDIGVSPDTLRERPSSKRHLSRRQLNFSQGLVALPPSPMGVENHPSFSTTVIHSGLSAPTYQASSMDEVTNSTAFNAPLCTETSSTIPMNSSALSRSMSDMSISASLLSTTETHTEPVDSELILPLSSEMNALSLSLPTVVLTELTNSVSAVEPPAAYSVKVSVISASDSSSTTYELPSSLCQLGEALGRGNMPSIAQAIIDNKQLADLVLQLIINAIDSECSVLCQRKPQACSLFRKINVGEMRNFKWSCLIDEISSKAPTLYRILYSLVSHSDHRNKKKAAEAHFPGICMTCAVLLKERNREMCGVQSMISFLLYFSHAEKQVYARLNQVAVCVSYKETLRNVEEISKLHTAPMLEWIANDIPFRFWGDNVDKKRNVRDVRIDHQGKLVHMYSILAGRSRTADPTLSHTGSIGSLSIKSESLLPTTEDIQSVKLNLVIIVSRYLTKYIDGLKAFSKAVPSHIKHRYSDEMATKSSVIVVDVLLKNEACHSDMIDIMSAMQNYLGSEYSEERRLLSGGDQLTCERQVGAQQQVMCGDTVHERLRILEPVTEDWHCMMCLLSVLWKKLYGKSSKDYGTLGYFRSLLNRRTVTADPKKAVDANVEFVTTVVKGHMLSCAFDILGIKKLDDKIQLPRLTSTEQKWDYIRQLAVQVVERCTLIDVTNNVADTDDRVYNYARVLCHYGSLLIEFRDAWAEGDGERVFRCWRLLIPHFKSSGRTKYALEALRFQLQAKALLSPQLAHQVKWDRFVNTRGGAGMNIPNDLYNEHIVKIVKKIIRCMGPNLTEKALQTAARSVSGIHAICKQYDRESGVPVQTTSHSTRSDTGDISKVIDAVQTNNLLHIQPGRQHSAYKKMSLNPIRSLDKKKLIEWIDKKKKDFENYMGACLEDEPDEDEEGPVDDIDDDDNWESVEEYIEEYTEEEALLFDSWENIIC